MSDLYLVHHGIKGQKWGIRKYQNEDGSVTPAGAERYYVGGKRAAGTNGGKTKVRTSSMPAGSKKRSVSTSSEQDDSAAKKAKVKKILAITAGVAVTAVAAYAGYKYVQNHPEKIAGLKQKLSDITGKKDSPMDLEKLGIKTFKPETFKPETIDVPRTEVNRVKVPTVNIQDKRAEYAEAIKKIEASNEKNRRLDEIRDMAEKQLRETKARENIARRFTWESAQRVDQNGRISSVSLPKDREGYAKAFASEMSKGSKNASKDYDYWYKYILSKMRSQ